MKIKEIKIVNQDESTEIADIGADAINVDYNNTTVKAELDKLNTDNNTNKNNITNLQTELDTTSSNLVIQTARIDNLAHLDEGSTTGDAELIDARIDFEGKEWNNLGTHIRSIETSYLDKIKSNFIFENIEWISDSFIRYDNTIVSESGWKRTNLIEIEDSSDLYIDGDIFFGSNPSWSYLINFYKDNEISNDSMISHYNPIESGETLVVKTFNFYKINIPETAKYVAFSYIDHPSAKHNFNIYKKNYSITTNDIEDITWKENTINIFSPGTISTSGNITYASDYKITDYMEVIPNTIYYRKNNVDIALIGCYSESKTWLRRKPINAGVSSFIIPEDVYYIKLCDSNEDMEEQVFGRVKTNNFIPYNTEYMANTKNHYLFKEIYKTINESIKKPLKGKNICLMGDSIAYGIGASIREIYSWASVFAHETECNLTNIAIPGASIQYRESEEVTAKSLYTLSTETNYNNFDYVIISAGTNDILGNIGTYKDNINTTACGALNLIIQNIMTSNPNIKIFFFGPMFRARFSSGDGHNSDDYAWYNKYVIDLADQLAETAERNHIPNYNLYRNFTLNKYNASILLSDGLHPNDEGHKRLASEIQSFIYSKIN